MTADEHARAFPSIPLRGLSGGLASSLAFAPPARVDVGGSFVLRTSTRASSTIDLAVTMPSGCFTGRDVKNYAYADKRALYTGALARVLVDSGLCASVEVSGAYGDTAKACLYLAPAASGGKPLSRALASCRVRIIPLLPSSSGISLNVLAPSWNNVRPFAFTGVRAPEGSGADAAAAPPTPRYNSSVAEDLTLLAQLQALGEAFAAVPVAREAVILLKSWARRWGWHTSSDGISGHLLTCIVAHLVQDGVLLPGMQVAQAARVCFTFLAATDLGVTDIALQPAGATRSVEDVEEEEEEERDPYDEDEEEDEEEEDMDEEEAPRRPAQSAPSGSGRLVEVTTARLRDFRAAAACVIVCPTGLVNLAWRVSAGAVAELRGAAGVALRALGTGNSLGAGAGEAWVDPSAFEASFAGAVPLSARFDRILVAPLPAWPLAPAPKGKAGDTSAHDATLLARVCNFESWPAAVASAAEGVVRTALGDRATLVRVMPVFAGPEGAVQAWPGASPLTWSLDAPPPTPTCMWVAVSTDPVNAGRLVDRGPTPDDTARVGAFVDLWGMSPPSAAGGPALPPLGRGLGEMRRFADGALVYAVVWDGARLGGRGHARDLIVPLTISHVLMRHCGVVMPVGVLHGGDGLLLGRSGGGQHVAVEAGRAVVYSDLAQACPGLALERALDMGQGGAVLARVTYGASKSGVAASEVRSSLTGIPAAVLGGPALGVSLSSFSAATVPAPAGTAAVEAGADPLSRGPASAVVAARTALSFLQGALKALPGMPLRIADVVPVSPGLRYTALHAPAPHPLCTGSRDGVQEDAPTAAGQARPIAGRALVAAATFACESAAALVGAGGGEGGEDESEDGPVACQTVPVHEVVLTLEASTKWPTDLPALAALKTALYLKIKYGVGGVTAGAASATAFPSHVDCTVGGFVFRCVIAVDAELALLERVAGREPMARARGKGAGAAVEEEEEGDGSRVGKARKIVGFVNVAVHGATVPEPTLRMAARKAAAASLGAAGAAAAVAGGMAKAELENAMRTVFHRGVGVTSALPGGEGPDTLTATAAGAALDAIFLQTVARPRHATAIHALAARFPAYGPTVRLAAAWLASHMLGPEGGWAAGGASATGPGAGDAALTAEREAYVHGLGPALSQEALELLVARVFTSPAPALAPPASPASAFHRFLRLLLSWDFEAEPMLVDVDGSATEGDARALAARFKQVRSQPTGAAAAAEPAGPALFLATSAERGAWRPLWTRAAPSWPQLGRLLAVAARTEELLSALLCPVLPALPTSAAASPQLHALALAGGGVARLPALFERDNAPFSLVLRTSERDLVPRSFLDGRSAGAVKRPLRCAAAVALAPAAAAAAVAAAPASGTSSMPLLLTLGVSADRSRFSLPLFRNLLPSSRAATLVGFDPVHCLARSLRRALGSGALVCVDGLEGGTVGVAFHQGALGEGARLLPSLTAMLLAGGDMIKSVSVT